jgi:hypothetical protein
VVPFGIRSKTPSASKEYTDQWLACETEDVVAGKAILVTQSGEGHCVITKGNTAACEVEARCEITVRRVIFFGSLARGASGNQPACENDHGRINWINLNP